MEEEEEEEEMDYFELLDTAGTGTLASQSEEREVMISMFHTMHNVIRKRQVNEEDENSPRICCRNGWI
jgi:hypothetical protein